MTEAAPSFSGSIPELYDRHLGPVLFEPYAAEVARRVPADAAHVLEIAAGTGRVTRQLLRALSAAATLLATDLSEAMLAEASRQLVDPRVTWRVADAQALPAADRAFDVVVCQFGLMFVPDKRRALREMHRVLRPGGCLLLTTWDRVAHNGATALLHELVLAAVPSDPPPHLRAPFSMFDPEELRQLALEGGFAEVAVDTVPRVAQSASAADLAAGFVRGNPLGAELEARGLDAATFEGTVAARLAERFGDQPCIAPISAHVLTARA